MASTQTQTKKYRTYNIRSSITPGTVLILLAGVHKGKRVVFLKQLKSGLLLVTGPYKVNGVPLRRVNHAYVIATSAKVDVSGVQLPEHIDDAYFTRKVEKNSNKVSEKEFFGDAKTKKTLALPEERKADQKSIDSVLLPLIKKEAHFVSYLGSKFALSKGQFPHALKF
ncbi:putative 60S ribosomal protein L6 [Neoconidiobolus thromboides FSU 785]|nr:putative 60S ribosomal protein L6 [Neoconidiobolus thromboides FSU 785]